MGRRRINAPRRGSLAYLPRGRSNRPAGKINYWPEVNAEKPRLLGFAGYKAGMSFLYVIGDVRGNPTFGQEIHSPVTIVDTPPMVVCGYRGYSLDYSGSSPSIEEWAEKLPSDLTKLVTTPKSNETKRAEATPHQKPVELRAILATQPRLSGSSRKKPELFEVKTVGGSIEDQLEYLKEGEYVDIIGITKGKGIQGPVKRWGVKTLPHKSRKTVRGVGTLGPWTPHYVMYTVPRAGQMGYHQRTEINKRILKIGNDGANVSPKGGFQHYGPIEKTYVILSGSIPGPARRLVKLRSASRPPLLREESKPVITYSPFRKSAE
jgi:large subunit ribosomal protein L3